MNRSFPNRDQTPSGKNQELLTDQRLGVTVIVKYKLINTNNKTKTFNSKGINKEKKNWNQNRA